MNARRRSALRGAWHRVLPVIAGGAIVLLAVPGWASAQTLSQRQNEYLAARGFLDAHATNWEAQEEVWTAWLDSIAAAERRGDRSALDEAERRVLREATELGRLERLVAGARVELAAKRSEFQQALEDEIDVLLARRPASPAERNRLTQQIDGHEAQLAQLRVEERELDQPLMFLYVRAAAVNNPRAGVLGMRSMIQIWERRLSEVLARIARVNQQIANIENRQRATRQAGDAATSLNRFGGGDLVGARTRETSAQVGATPLTAEEELEQLRTQLGHLRSLQGQLQANIAELQGRIGAGGGNP